MAARRGVVEAIYIGAEAMGPMAPVASVRAIEGAGLDGDRYSRQAGTFSRPHKLDAQVTLIEAEAVEAVNRDYKIALETRQTRRNVVTRGVALNHLVGKRFMVGGVTLEGTKLCDPCNHLEQLTLQGVKHALTHRGGLCASIVSGGTISTGDSITLEAPAD